MEQQFFAAGEVIFREGDAGTVAYLVAEGTVEITRLQDRRAVALGEIAAGHLFGEMALISEQPRTATARALTDTTCFVIPVAAFHAELGGANAFMRALVLSLIGHVRSLMAQLDTARTEAAPSAELPPEAVVYHPLDHKTYRTEG